MTDCVRRLQRGELGLAAAIGLVLAVGSAAPRASGPGASFDLLESALIPLYLRQSTSGQAAMSCNISVGTERMSHLPSYATRLRFIRS
jgi:hypothetical protein